MHASVVALRRYPVKSMGGEALEVAPFDLRGLAGDRWYAVTDTEGRLASGKDSRRFRRRDAVFGYAAHTVGGRVVVARGQESWRVGSPDLDAELSSTMGTPVRVLSEAEVPHQDDGGVSVIGTATLAWCAERWGGLADPRRIRANVLLATDEPFVEETWSGRQLAVGSTVLRIGDRIPRCRMIDIVQDGVAPESRWLRSLTDLRGMCLAVYAHVAEPGEIAVGDRLDLADEVLFG